jgi:predicted secreted protein
VALLPAYDEEAREMRTPAAWICAWVALWAWLPLAWRASADRYKDAVYGSLPGIAQAAELSL